MSEKNTKCIFLLLYSENTLLDFLADFCVFYTFFLKTEVTTNEGEYLSFFQIELFVELGREHLKYICVLFKMEEHCQPGIWNALPA